jgi:putative PIN family toxin of toxin-antitoxin system
MKAPPRVVLDTNIVLSALIFGGESATRIRTGWQSARYVPLASAATAQELLSALGYPKFGLSVEEQSELLADYMPWVEVVRIPDPPPRVPNCRDPFDMPFLELAVAGRARALVTRDLDLLVLTGARGFCPILGMDAFCSRFLKG